MASSKSSVEDYTTVRKERSSTINMVISLIPEELTGEIAACEPIAYSKLKGRLYRRGMRMRVDELRDY